MGFETRTIRVITHKTIIWTFFPMGFETCSNSLLSFPVAIWTFFPMGFETIFNKSHWVCQDYLNILPYGIWNLRWRMPSWVNAFCSFKKLNAMLLALFLVLIWVERSTNIIERKKTKLPATFILFMFFYPCSSIHVFLSPHRCLLIVFDWLL